MKNASRSRRPVRKTFLAAATSAALMAVSAPTATAQPAAVEHVAHTAGTKATDPVVTGVPYHLINQENRGVTFEPYLNWDYALLTNSPGSRGTAVVFEKKDDGYVIKSTSSHWSGYNTWCAAGNGIKLDQEGNCASRWEFVPSYTGYLLRLAGTQNYVSQPVGGKGWLVAYASALPHFREFTAFKPVQA
ncbi:hypothetical protein [Streptomyces halobius]|uniref:Uncharacterized protein n=1 Tax=Streptomyces halobius TaxID=2879846 RepID=A0ABY4MCC2_9ACTN|nr:hypothetical protein [Streptomyces halobius]UQA94967.1 hypothetical protein K9S39_26705 [Streptomyces halobius]